MDCVNLYKKYILKSFGFLIEKYMFILTDEDEYSLQLSSVNCRITFEIDRNQVFIDIKYLKDIIEEKDMFELINIILPNSNLEGYVCIISSERGIEKETERLANIMQSYCIDLINGDKGLWDMVHKKYSVT